MYFQRRNIVHILGTKLVHIIVFVRIFVKEIRDPIVLLIG